MDALDIKTSSNIGGSFLCAACRCWSPYVSYSSLSAGLLSDGRTEIGCHCMLCGANNIVARFATDPSGAEAIVRYA